MQIHKLCKNKNLVSLAYAEFGTTMQPFESACKIMIMQTNKIYATTESNGQNYDKLIFIPLHAMLKLICIHFNNRPKND